jgi:hypothetical protein
VYEARIQDKLHYRCVCVCVPVCVCVWVWVVVWWGCCFSVNEVYWWVWWWVGLGMGLMRLCASVCVRVRVRVLCMLCVFVAGVSADTREQERVIWTW